MLSRCVCLLRSQNYTYFTIGYCYVAMFMEGTRLVSLPSIS